MRAHLPLFFATFLLSACGGGGSTPSTLTTAPATPTTPSAIDLTKLPLGDGRVSTTAARVGYVFACTLPTSSNPAGKAPWINADGVTWNATAKITVQGAVTWASTFATNLANGMLSISGNGLPAHPTGTFPVSAADPAYAYDKNPNAIQAASVAWGLPGNPVVAVKPTCTDLGAIGILLTGARLYNALDADGRDAAAHEVQDACGGHPQGQGAYHYHDLARCMTQVDTAGSHSPLVGYIADGFGIYGNLGEQGKALTNADLDACHGHTHALTINGATVTQYHYHTTKEYPYTIGCYAGTPVRIR
ncbi:YHYH protein [Massilia sp. CF038]|uniref:YHYH protein n=1 Tax=Massilia sp. CF038 TaxID=1881045 RepID=UPI000911ED51|nr:YHYH protein [Massilia sp. CF038]SHH27234.1 YHYH protein [Massilia sp. CF038]